MNIIYIIYIWSGVIGLICSALLINDETYWSKMKRYNSLEYDDITRTRIMVVSSLFPLVNSVYAVVMILLIFIRWRYPERWDGW